MRQYRNKLRKPRSSRHLKLRVSVHASVCCLPPFKASTLRSARPASRPLAPSSRLHRLQPSTFHPCYRTTDVFPLAEQGLPLVLLPKSSHPKTRRSPTSPHIGVRREHENPLVHLTHVTRGPLPVAPWCGPGLFGKISTEISIVHITLRTFTYLLLI